MTYFVTPTLGLSLANPGTGQAFETTVVNNDFVLVDTAIGNDRTRLGLLEASVGRGTQTIFYAATPAALNAIVGNPGDLAVLKNNGNVYLATFQYIFGKWQNPTNVLFSDVAPATLASFATYINAGVNTNIVISGAGSGAALTGQQVYLANGVWSTGTFTQLQTDTVNTYTPMITQTGKGKMTGNGTAQQTKAVTFPVAFSAIPTIIISAAGYQATGAFSESGLSASTNFASLFGQTAAGFVAAQTISGATLSASFDYHYDWVAVGPA